jgi:hypothetical protein
VKAKRLEVQSNPEKENGENLSKAAGVLLYSWHKP